LRKGLSTAKGDYIVLAEPDGTFNARDITKLLKPLAHYDCVLGTRTNSAYIQPGANMKFFLRFGNKVVAKYMQLLWQMPSLSDCGCTFRVLKKQVVTTILPELTVGGSHFLPEMVVTIQKHRFSLVEVPVRYQPRIGVSKITGSLSKSLKVGWAMIYLITKNRLWA
jgi:hypothetical protein